MLVIFWGKYFDTLQDFDRDTRAGDRNNDKATKVISAEIWYLSTLKWGGFGVLPLTSHWHIFSVGPYKVA